MATGQVRTESELLEYFKDNVTNDIYPVDLRDFVVTMFYEVAAVSGVSSYVYIAYADDAAGTGFTLAFDPTKDYIAIRNTTSPIGSPGPGDFTGLWTKYRGDKGDPGYSLLTGIVDPLPGDGLDGDTYLNIVTYDFFGPKSGGVWGAGTTIIGNGIAGISLFSSAPPVDTYRITYTDATTFDYNVTNGVDGATGNGVAGVALIGTVANVDTYRMTFTDATFFDYTVTNSQDLAVGVDGDIQFATSTVLDADSDFNWDKTNKILNVVGDCDATLVKTVSPGAISTSGTGWHVIANLDAEQYRGAGEIVINDPGSFGGNFSGTYVIKYGKDNRNGGSGWVVTGTLMLENYGDLSTITDVRLAMNAIGVTFLEIYTPFAITGFDVYETQLTGNNNMGDLGVTAPAGVVNTGLLPNSAGITTTLVEKSFQQRGLSTENADIGGSLITGGSRILNVRRVISSGTFQTDDHLIEIFNDSSVVVLNLTASLDGREIIIRNLSQIQNAQFRAIGSSMNIDGVAYASVAAHTLAPGMSTTIYYSSTDNRWYNFN